MGRSAPRPRRISKRQIGRAVRFAVPILRTELGPGAVDQVISRMASEYGELAGAVPPLQAPMSRMTLRLAVDAVALRRSLPAGTPADCVQRIVSGFVGAWMRGQFESGAVRWVYAHRWSHLLLRRSWFASANARDEANGWSFRFIPGGAGLFYGVDVARCGIVTFLTANGAAELGPILCRGDYAIARYLPSGVRFERSQVIAEGAPFCDFRYREPSAD